MMVCLGGTSIALLAIILSILAKPALNHLREH
jgi:hypothetical protein